MVLTRSEAKAAFNHVLDTILGRGDNSLLKSALSEEGVDDIFALSTLTDNAIDRLQFKDPCNNNALTSIKLADKMLLRCFLHYVVYCSAEGNPVGDDWNAITQEKFDAFRIDPTYLSKLISMPISMSASPASHKVVFWHTHLQHCSVKIQVKGTPFCSPHLKTKSSMMICIDHL
jgi:hypothetical protein